MTRAPRKTRTAVKWEDYEHQDAPPKGVVYALGGVFALIAITAGLMFAMYRVIAAAHHTAPSTPIERTAQIPPEPHLEPYPTRDLAAVRAEEAAHLTGYGWTDRKTGLAHIPIDRAMQLEVQRGWTDRPGASKP